MVSVDSNLRCTSSSVRVGFAFCLLSFVSFSVGIHCTLIYMQKAQRAFCTSFLVMPVNVCVCVCVCVEYIYSYASVCTKGADWQASRYQNREGSAAAVGPRLRLIFVYVAATAKILCIPLLVILDLQYIYTPIYKCPFNRAMCCASWWLLPIWAVWLWNALKCDVWPAINAALTHRQIDL